MGHASTRSARRPKESRQYEMLGAELGPGGERFGRAILIDKNIHEATGTNPELAVSSTGHADLVYRVVEQSRDRRRRATPRAT